jgi:hypothetical protein
MLLASRPAIALAATLRRGICALTVGRDAAADAPTG